MSTAKATSSTPRLSALPSLLLDIVRFGAAISVAVGHLTQSYFSTGWTNRTTHAVESVGIFFVLSGFVIRYITRFKYYRQGEYWIDRAARIYSVVLPAMLLTIFADWIALHANRDFYLTHWGRYMNHPVSRVVENLFFTSQFWSKSTAFFSNGPFWSLSYECLYYGIYGCAFYLRGAFRYISVLALIALGGIHIALLFPLFIFGCVLYELFAWLTAKPAGWRIHLCFAGIGTTAYLLWLPTVDTIFAVKSQVVQVMMLRHHRLPDLHWMLDYYRVGIPAGFLMLWGLVLVHGISMRSNTLWVRVVQLLADSTFPLYLIHFPVYVLIASVIPYNHGSPSAKIVMLFTVIAFGVLLVFPTNRLKNKMRSALRRLFLPHDRLPPARSTVLESDDVTSSGKLARRA